MYFKSLIVITATLFGAVFSNMLCAQQVSSGSAQTVKPVTTFHGESASLLALARSPVVLAEGAGLLFEEELEPLYEEPAIANANPPQALLQSGTPSPANAVAGVSFEGPGVGLTGFVLTGAPPDMTLAVGPNHVVAWVNSQYAVFNKIGTPLLPGGSTNGNNLWAGLGNVCESTNRGDPILQYDRLAQRWILSQFAFATGSGGPSAPYMQCFAISTTSDPMGTYYRYSVTFSPTSPSGLNDYGKLGVWPDAYYTSYNIFGGSPAGSNTGVALCASDRVKMLAGDPTATTLCAPTGFYGGGAAFLPADLDGTTLPSDVSQGGLFLRYSTTLNLRLIKLKPDFVNSTVTLTDGFGGISGSFINIPVAATTLACNGTGGACIAQPGTTNVLDTLGSRLMYRLAFRNRNGVESLLVTQSVDPDGAGSRGSALRWYEIRNPLGNPADVVVANRPTLHQSATYDPGATGDRWMGSIAMDRYGNMMLGYSIANAGAGLRPSIAVAGRQFNDPLNTLQAEIIAHTGTGSQTGALQRWGDYSTIQTDPVDDRTFWYISQYLAADGTFNWRTRIVSYGFPPPPSFSIADVNMAEGNSGDTNMVFTITRSSTVDAVSVRVDTANGTAIAGSDYTAVSNQVVNFTAGGAATATVNVPITGDTIVEPAETFSVNLSNPTGGAVIDAGIAIGTINNDDTATVVSSNVSQAEGNSGNTNMVFTATLDGQVQGGFTMPYSTANNTALAGSDYVTTSGGLNFTGNNAQALTISVPIIGDLIPEPNETFFLNFGVASIAGVSANPAQVIGEIVNDDLFADIVVTIDDGISTLRPLQTTAYTVTITNTSSIVDVAAVNLLLTMPAVMQNISWTCAAINGATCSAPTGTGSISQTRAFPKTGRLTFVVSATPASGPPPAVIDAVMTAVVVAPHSDPNTSNNTVTDSNTLLTDGIFFDGFE